MSQARDCIARNIKDGRIPADRGRRMLAQLAEFERTYGHLGPVDGAHRAAKEMAATIAAEAKRKRELTQRQIMAFDRLQKTLANDPKGAVHAAVHTMLALDKHREAVRGLLHGMVTEGLRRFRSKALGFKRDRAGEANVVRALYGEATDDKSAAEIAQMYGDAFEYGRTRKNAAGANVAKRKDWRLPNPSHDMRRIYEVGRQEWKDAVLPLLDDTTFDDGQLKMQVAADRELAWDNRQRLVAESKAKQSEVAAYNRRIKGVEARIRAAEVRQSGDEGKRAALLKEYEAQLGRLMKHREDAKAQAAAARRPDPVTDGKPVTLGDVRDVVEADALGQDELVRYLEEAIADLRGASAKAKPGQTRARARENQASINRIARKTNTLADRTSGTDDLMRRLEDERTRLVDRRKTVEMERADVRKQMDQWQQSLRLLDERLARLRDPVASKSEFLDHVYDTLSTDGLNKLVPGQGGAGRGRLASRDDDAHRVLIFKDADSWMTYNDRFGNGDIFQTLNGHMDGLAHDIAFLETLGPNPEAGKRFMVDAMRKADAEEAGAGTLSYKGLQSRARGIKHFENVYDDVSGTSNTPVSQRMARVSSGIRATLVSAQLGSAFISSMTDVVTMAMTARFNSLPATKIIAKSLKLMVSERDQAAAVQLGLVADGWTRIAGANMRYAGEVFNDGFAGRLADFTMRASLLKPATEARQWAFGMEFLGSLGRIADQDWSAMPAKLRRAMERYGMGEAEWNLARRGLVEIDGARFLKPEVIARLDEPRATEVATTLHRMVLEERDYAVIMGDARTRAWLRQGTRAGTVGGELMRFLGMYKSFPITVISRHFGRALELSGRERVSYFAALFVGSTIMGMAAWQAKQLVRGKDAGSMDPTTDEGRAAWGAAMLQGGGAGIFGDFLFADQNRFGGGLTTTLAGPAAGLASDLMKFTVGNAQEAIRGEDPEILAEAIALGGRYTPGSSIWYARLALERAVLDQLTLMADPDAPRRFRRMEREMRKDYGQRYWWRPGEAGPRRAPEISTMVE